MHLRNELIEFIEDEGEYRNFMMMFNELLSAYHDAYNSGEFKFDYIRFVTEWQNEKLALFISYDGDKPIGFLVASVTHAFFDDNTTLTLTHAFLKEEYRGDMGFIKSAIEFVISKADKFNCTKTVVLTDPVLMPLIAAIGGTNILYNGVEIQ